LVDRVLTDGLIRFAARAVAAILLGTFMNEAVVEPYVFATGPISSEGIYYGLVDALTTVAVFVVLRLARRLHALSREGAARADTELPPVKPAEADADRLFVRVGSETRRIFASDVVYMEAERDFTRVVCVNGEHFVSESLKSLLERSGEFGLVRVHKSFAANIHRVDRATRSGVHLGASQVPVGRRYWKAFAAVWKPEALVPPGLGSGSVDPRSE
jgi:DNA-binding LytR/AlgR family response regulator